MATNKVRGTLESFFALGQEYVKVLGARPPPGSLLSVLTIPAAVSIFVIATALSLLARLCASKPRRASLSEGIHPLFALQTILVPTQSRWPEPLLAAVHRAKASQDKTIWIPFDEFLAGISSGTIELRDPPRDLPSLVQSRGALTQGWRIRFHVDSGSMRKAAAWYHRTHRYPNFKFDTALGQKVKIPAEGSLPGGPMCQLHMLDLDLVPPSELSAMIQHLHTLPSNTMVAVMLTSRDPSVSPTHHQFAKMALPFLPRPCTQKRPTSLLRTTTAFTTSFATVLEQLNSDPASLTVLDVENMFGHYSEALCFASKMLEDDGNVRASFIRNNRIEEWREERLYGYWESALVKAGLLTKWKVIVVKK